MSDYALETEPGYAASTVVYSAMLLVTFLNIGIWQSSRKHGHLTQ
jgi:hypothetical protein